MYRPICYFAVSHSDYAASTIQVSVNRSPVGQDTVRRYRNVSSASARRVDALFGKANYHQLPGYRLIVWVYQREVKAVLTNV